MKVLPVMRSGESVPSRAAEARATARSCNSSMPSRSASRMTGTTSPPGSETARPRWIRRLRHTDTPSVREFTSGRSTRLLAVAARTKSVTSRSRTAAAQAPSSRAPSSTSRAICVTANSSRRPSPICARPTRQGRPWCRSTSRSRPCCSASSPSSRSSCAALDHRPPLTLRLGLPDTRPAVGRQAGRPESALDQARKGAPRSVSCLLGSLAPAGPSIAAYQPTHGYL